MSRIYNCVLGSLDGCPYAPRAKQNIFSAIGKALGSVGGPLVSGGLSLLGDIINSNAGQSSQDAANRTNLEIARMNNEQQYKMFQEQNAFNLDMWNKQNEYNDPKEQVKRLLAAGINPAGVFGSGSVSEAGSLQSANAPQLQQARVNPYQPNFGVGEAVNAFQQSMQLNAQRDLLKAQEKKTNAETTHTETLNLLDTKTMQYKVDQLRELAKKEGALGDIARSELSFMQDSYYWRMKSLRQDITAKEDEHDLTRERIYNQRLLNGLAEVQLAYAPQLSQAELNQYYATVNQLKAQVGLINANKLLTDEQRLHEIEKKSSTIIDTKLKKFDYKLKKATKDFIIQDAKNHSMMLDFERRNQKSGERLRRLASVVPFASAGYKIGF